MNNKILKVDNLTKKFNQIVAVNNISFSIGKGEILGLLGPNGAGKTTTIQMLLGLITPTKGRIEIFGKDFLSHREEILSRTNFSSSYTHLPWRLTVWENLHVVALLYSVPHPKRKIDEIIKLMKLTTVKDKTILELSSGWITKINLARTLLNSPDLMFLDEPTSSLDPESADEIRGEIMKFTKTHGSSILWTSHNMSEVEEICDRVIFLHKGKILAVDTPFGLANRIKKCRITFMIGTGKNRLREITKKNSWKLSSSDRFETVELPEVKIPVFLNLIVEHRINYSQISIEKPTLEDYFISTAKKYSYV